MYWTNYKFIVFRLKFHVERIEIEMFCWEVAVICVYDFGGSGHPN